MTTFHFFAIPQGFQGQNPKYRGGNVKGVGRLHSFGAYNTLWIGIGLGHLWGLNFEF